MFTFAIPDIRGMTQAVFANLSAALNKVVPCYNKLQGSVLHSH